LKSLINVLNRYLVYIISFVFIAFNLWQISKDFMWLGLLPMAVVFVVIAIFRLDALLILTVFFVPLSVPLRELSGGLSMDLFLPSELLLIITLFIVIIKRIKGETFHKKLLYHPVSIAIYLNLVWLLVTSITSTMPLVSFKFFLARLWFLVAFYFLAAEIFKKVQNMNRFLWAYMIPLLIVIGYTVSRHVSIGLFDQQAAHYVMNPFYNDHTSYGAILAMMIPVAVGFVIDRNKPFLYKVFSFAVLGILIAAIILSFSRAAWVSLIASAGIFLLVILKIRFRTFLIIISVVSVFFIIQLDNITQEMEKNRQQSSANLSEHVQSISNITTDDSNLERLNRWSCAWRMFLTKPIMGWGPGTYMFQYAPFQVSTEKTLISTNMADRGNAHSEYLGPLSESGLFGMLTFLGIVTMTLIAGFKTYWKLKDRKLRILILSVILGLITYYIHGIMNNFLDTDKASAPFWGFTAIIVALDIFSKQAEKDKSENPALPENGKEDESLV
jgi:putative inorganic carbon (hco3(-)) transporter